MVSQGAEDDGAAGLGHGSVYQMYYAAFTMPRDSPFHNVSIPLGDATMVEHCVPRRDGRRLTAVYPGYACRKRRLTPNKPTEEL